MITLYFGDKPYEYPNSWDELTPDQFLFMLKLINQYWASEISLGELRIAWFKNIAELEELLVSRRSLGRYNDNVLTASRQFDFFYTLDYGDALADLSPEVRSLLRKTPADEISSSNPEIRYARSLEYEYKLDFIWHRNLLPTIELGGNTHNGWSARVADGVLFTSMTAMQFMQGIDLLAVTGQGDSLYSIHALIVLLYKIDSDQPELMKAVEELSDITKQGIVLNFQAFVSYIFKCKHYSILWNPTVEENVSSRKIKSAMSDSLYPLCEKGFGSLNEIKQMSLLDYLAIMRSELITSIRTMSKSGEHIDEIASRTGLSISIIQTIL